MRVALAEDGRVDIHDPAVGTFRQAFDDDRRAVRDLLIAQPQDLFANDLRNDDLFGLIGDRVVVKEMSALDAVLFQLVEQRVKAFAGLCGDRHHRVKVVQLRIAQDRLHQLFLLIFEGVDLVQREDRGHTGSLEFFDQRQLALFDLILTVDDQHGGVAVRNRFIDRLDHIFAQLGFRLMQTGRVDKDKLIVALRQDPRDTGAGGLRLGRNDRDLMTEQAVEDR